MVMLKVASYVQWRPASLVSDVYIGAAIKQLLNYLKSTMPACNMQWRCPILVQCVCTGTLADEVSNYTYICPGAYLQ